MSSGGNGSAGHESRPHGEPRATSEGSDGRIPARTLATDVGAVVDELGDVPTITEYDRRGRYSARTIALRFGDGSWMDALESLGYEVTTRPGSEIDREELRADVHEVADTMDRPPTQEEYTRLGRYSPDAVADRFGDGSWLDALETLGYDLDDRDRTCSADELRRDLAAVADQLGRAPTSVEYKAHGEYSPITVARRFGSGTWTDALQALGYDPSARDDERTPLGPVRDALDRVRNELGRVPTKREFAERTEFDPQTLANEYGNGLWKGTLDVLGYDASEVEPPHVIPDRALRADLERVVAELDRVPTAAEYDDRGEYAAQTIGNRFGSGSWLAALDLLGYALPEDGPRNRIPDRALRADVERVIDELGKLPTGREYDDVGEYSATTIANRLGDGSWVDALEAVDERTEE